MRIAFIGLKGLPGTFSGVETHVHELGGRLVKRGHEVAAYVRPHYTPRHVTEHAGMRLIHRPTLPTKHLDALVHSLFSSLHTITADYDIVHFHTIGPAVFAPIARLSGARIVTTIHRFDYLSGKWGWFARSSLRLAEQVALRGSHGTIVVAPFLKEHYEAHGHPVTYIPNGVTLPAQDIGCSGIADLGLEPGKYLLFLGRLVPEKRPDWAIRAFLETCRGPERLVITGGSSSTDAYVEHLKELARPAGDRVLFTGPIYGDVKEELLANAKAFLLPSALEGLPITLLEAMSHGQCCLVSDIPPHRDVIADGDNGFMHRDGDFQHLCERMHEVVALDSERLRAVGASAKRTVAENYDWDRIVDDVERLYSRVCRQEERQPLSSTRP
jgi:glycosyltransferase involved in cell wall biosynthesis